MSVAAIGALAALTMACSPNEGPASPEESAAQSAPPSTEQSTENEQAAELSADGTLTAPTPGGNAATYNEQLAPVGARVKALLTPSGEGTEVKLTVTGLTPDRGYAVHAHTKPCGATGDEAGPHFQHRVDPAATPDEPSSDPAYANPQNEVWLDLTTDASGGAEATTTVPFQFTDSAPRSIVVHEEMATKTGPGEAGMAGDRVACLTLPESTDGER